MKFRPGGSRLQLLAGAVVALACLTSAGPAPARAGDGGGKPSPDAKPPSNAKPAPDAKPAPVTFGPGFSEGESLRYRTNGGGYQFVSMGGQGFQSREEKTSVRSFAVGRRRADGALPIAVKVESLHVDLNIQRTIHLTFDSKSPEASKVPGPEYESVLEPYRWESASAYTVVLDGGAPRFVVKAVEGTDAARQRASALDPLSRAQVAGSIEPDRLRARFERGLRVLPDGPVRPGDSWERTGLFDGGEQPLSVRERYTYVGPEKHGGRTLAKITSKALEVTCPPPGPHASSPLTIARSKLKVDSSEGTFLFDPETGRLVESREKAKLSGQVTFSADGAETSSNIDLSWWRNTRLDNGPQAK